MVNSHNRCSPCGRHKKGEGERGVGCAWNKSGVHGTCTLVFLFLAPTTQTTVLCYFLASIPFPSIFSLLWMGTSAKEFKYEVCTAFVSFVCSAWMRYHKHIKRKKALLAKKMESARLWHRQRLQKIHLHLWIVSLHNYFLFSGIGIRE